MNKSFDFISFFKKYELPYSEELVKQLVDSLNNGDTACDFVIVHIDKRCIELEQIIRNSHSWDKYYHHLIKTISHGWRCVDRVETSNVEERILDGASWLVIYALKEGKIPQYS